MVTQNHGATHPTDEEVTISVAGIPGVPGLLTAAVNECDEVEDTVDTYDTIDGQPHSAGRSRSSKEWKATVYANDTTIVAGFEAWQKATKAGVPGHKVPLTITYPYVSGVPGRVKELQNCVCTSVRDSGGGQTRAHTITIVCRYQNAKTILA